MKTCSICKETKSLEDFYLRKNRKTGRRSECKVCSGKISRKWFDSNVDKEKERMKNWREGSKGTDKFKESRRKAQLKYLYKLTPEEYDQLLISQGGGCAICGTSNPGVRRTRFCIDHDHLTGKVRGLLCAQHNTGLGMFEDNLDLLKQAVKYLGRT